MEKIKIPIEISARHLHISEKDFIKLFGKKEKLNAIRNLSQPREFASDKFVSLINKKNKIEKVRILGPFRKKSQLEISLTDAYNLELNPFPKIKVSGDLFNSSKVLVKGKISSIKIPCIIAKRHIHLSEQEAKKMNIRNNQKLKIKINGQRSLILEEVIARISKDYLKSLHLDTDEANAAGISKKTFGEIVK